jgi:hypothetical protein
MTQAQQSFYRKHRYFTNSVVGLKAAASIRTTPAYYFAIRTTTRGAFHYAVPRSRQFKAYVSATFLEDNSPQNNPQMISVVCEAVNPDNTRPADPRYKSGVVDCGQNTVMINTP